MKAVVYTGPEAMELREVAAPALVAGSSIVQIEAVGICGSDMHAYLGHDARRPAPLILGHEAAGVVIAGADVGARVTINPLVTNAASAASRRGQENLCPDRQIISMPPREGAFAEEVVIPDRNLVAVPDGVSLSKAALAEPLAVCWHAVRMCSELPWGRMAAGRTLVIGGGAIGFGTVLCLRAFGAGDVTLVEANAARAEHLRGILDCPVISPDAVKDDSYDTVIDAVGFRGTREVACRATVPGGVICHIGLGDSDDGLDIRRITLQEITFFGTYTYTMADFRDTAAAIFDGRLGALDWIEERPLADGPQAFKDLRAGKVLAPKIILRP